MRPEWNKDERGGGIPLLLRFFVRHGEKVIAGILIIAAVGFALPVRNHQPLTWTPDDLVEMANTTENIIENNNLTFEDNDIKFFDFATFATQMRERVPIEPYRSNTEWYPVLHPAPQPRGGFEILTARSLRGEAVRRAGLTAQGKTAEQWQRPPMPGTGTEKNQEPVQNFSPIWVNLYGTLPVWEQWDIYNQIINSADGTSRPEYVYYELERTAIKPNEMPAWQPVSVYSTAESPTNESQTNQSPPARLIPFRQPQESLQDQDLLLFSDFDIEPAATYAYRIRLYVRNPNYHLQETSVEVGVDTQSEFVRSDWSSFARVYVPDRTVVQLLSVIPTDQSDFPRQTMPLNPMKGTLVLDYFDMEQGLSLPLVEKRNVLRGMLVNMSKGEANRIINNGSAEVVVNYPDAGLRSNVCIMDFSGGRKLQKRLTRESQASPDLFVPGKALLLMPDGTMQITTTEPELFW